MTLFWLWVSAGCLVAAGCGFSAARLGVRRLAGVGGRPDTGTEHARGRRQARSLVFVASAPTASERPLRPAVPRRRAAAVRPEPVPVPTAPRPDAEKLALWARQVEAGERKMSVATDGCRVTWNRTCKHGHPTWLVYLGYLKRREPPKRHNPR